MIARLVRRGSPTNRILLGGLVAIWGLLLVNALVGTVLIDARFAVDLEIPLRATERWLAGGSPYEADAFLGEPGATQPFLYPPFVLPLLAPLTELPRAVVGAVWVAAMFLASVFALHRLGVRPWVMPLILLWPPFAEAIYGGNVQALLFAAFVALLWRGGPGHPPRDLADPHESAARIGVLAAVGTAIKVSQPHTWLLVLRHRPTAAILAAAIGVACVALTLPLTGIDVWWDWVAQLRLASDPTWDLGGFHLARWLPAGVGLLVAAACAAAVLWLPSRGAGAAVGLLAVVGSLSLHIFGLMFLLPALLVVRLELALLAAICVTTYSYQGAWAGIAIAAVAYAAARTRWPALREPTPVAAVEPDDPAGRAQDILPI